jgi:hypothetical protein
MFDGSSEVDLVRIMPLKKYKPVGWGDAGTPTITPGVNLCWGKAQTPTYNLFRSLVFAQINDFGLTTNDCQQSASLPLAEYRTSCA